MSNCNLCSEHIRATHLCRDCSYTLGQNIQTVYCLIMIYGGDNYYCIKKIEEEAEEQRWKSTYFIISQKISGGDCTKMVLYDCMNLKSACSSSEFKYG